MAADLPGAYALLVRMLVTLRLVSPRSGEPLEASRALVAQACGAGSWAELVAAYDGARRTIAAEWARISAGDFGETKELNDAERR